MTTRACWSCVWFRANANEGPLYDGACVRYPPRVIHRVGLLSETRWPDVMASDWCGEYVEPAPGNSAQEER